jgi:hypothetical protein
MAPQCPFYMVHNNSLGQHLFSIPTKCPAFHKSIKLNFKKTEKEILEIIKNGECIEKGAHITVPVTVPEHII